MADPVSSLSRLGGVARWGALRRTCSRRQLRRAVRDGRIVRTAYGRYAHPHADAARLAGSRLTGTVSHTSAALHWGWAVKTAPAEPHVTVSRHRKIDRPRRDGVLLHWRGLRPDEVTDGWVTSPVRTVIDCCFDLPFGEALAVFDSSWRAGLKPREVQLAALRLPVRQRNRVWAVARAADPRAASPFESVPRSIAMTVPTARGAAGRRQGDRLLGACRPGRRRAAHRSEADSFEFHTSRTAFDRDCRRYNGLVVRDWLVVRFT
ncbi:MAG: hypothetical protein ABJA74_12420 [Lapillicoccus sp.]